MEAIKDRMKEMEELTQRMKKRET